MPVDEAEEEGGKNSTRRGNVPLTSAREIARQEVRKEAKKSRPAPSSIHNHNQKKARVSANAKIPWCGLFNKSGCTNQRVGPDGCRGPDGKLYLHSCNVDVDGSKCGAWRHNAKNCPNKK